MLEGHEFRLPDLRSVSCRVRTCCARCYADLVVWPSTRSGVQVALVCSGAETRGDLDRREVLRRGLLLIQIYEAIEWACDVGRSRWVIAAARLGVIDRGLRLYAKATVCRW